MIFKYPLTNYTYHIIASVHLVFLTLLLTNYSAISLTTMYLNNDINNILCTYDLHITKATVGYYSENIPKSK